VVLIDRRSSRCQIATHRDGAQLPRPVRGTEKQSSALAQD
jgi:hypothetical protein